MRLSRLVLYGFKKWYAEANAGAGAKPEPAFEIVPFKCRSDVRSRATARIPMWYRMPFYAECRLKVKRN